MTHPFKIAVYRAESVETLASPLFVAHAFTQRGEAQVATCYGASAEECRARLDAFLSRETARASPSRREVDPAKSAEARRRALIGVAKRKGQA